LRSVAAIRRGYGSGLMSSTIAGRNLGAGVGHNMVLAKLQGGARRS